MNLKYMQISVTKAENWTIMKTQESPMRITSKV
jgi:hypothetical protein